MATLVEFSVAADDFPFGALFAAVPGASVELERIVPTTESLFPYVWIRGGERAAIESALESAAAVTAFTLIDDLGDRGLLYRATWSPTVDGIIDTIVASNVTLLSAIGKRDRWRFRLRADDHGSIGAFQDRCREKGIRIDVSRLQPLGTIDRDDEITAAQLEALELAYERGYFDDPRRATLDELATELGITRQSLAGRLRRGHRNVLAGLFGLEGENGGRRRSFGPTASTTHE